MVFGSGEGKIDVNDSLVSPFFVLASGVQANLFALVLFGFDFSTIIFSVGSGAEAVEVSAARMIAVTAILVALATNKPDFSAMGTIQVWTAVTTIGLVLAPPFSPALQSLIGGSTVAGIFALVIQSAGFYALSYLG